MTETVAGKVRGEAIPAGVAFRGIPFAEPPTGTRRFMPPDPCIAWDGVRDARAAMTAGSTAVCDKQTAEGAGPALPGECSVWGARLADGRARRKARGRLCAVHADPTRTLPAAS